MGQEIRGQTYYFGPWADPQAALEEYLRQKDYLLTGRSPYNGEGLSVKQLVNSFLNSKMRLVDSGELRERSFQDYYDNCERVIRVLGKNRHVSLLRPVAILL